LQEAANSPLYQHEGGIARGRSADRADPKLLGNSCVDLAVVMARHQNAYLEIEDSRKGQHQVLTVPHRENDRREMDVTRIWLGWIETQTAGGRNKNKKK